VLCKGKYNLTCDEIKYVRSITFSNIINHKPKNMKIKIMNSLLMGSAVIALILGSCQKQGDKLPGRNELANTGKILLGCTLTDTSIVGSGSSFNDYCSWNHVDVSLAGGPAIRWEGFSNSFIRPVTAQYYIGTTAIGDTCDNWTTIRSKITVKNAHLGTDPNCATARRYNVVGINGPFAGVFDYGLGYYSYTIPTPTVDSAVVIWRDTSISGDSTVSNPASLLTTNAFVIYVRSFAVGGSGPYTDTVRYAYKKI
jgi:hypothetical protein